MYTITPGEGDATLVIENIRSNSKIEVPRATRAQLSKDGKKVVAVIKPLFSQTRDAKIKKAKKDDMPKDTLAIVDLATGKIEKFANYKSHNTPDKLSSYIAFELTPAKEKPAPKGKDAKDAKKPEKKAPVKELYVMNIATGAIDTIKNVSSYKFNKGTKALREGALDAYNTVLFQMNFSSNISITRDSLIEFRGKIYQIQSLNEDHRDNKIIIRATEMTTQVNIIPEPYSTSKIGYLTDINSVPQ